MKWRPDTSVSSIGGSVLLHVVIGAFLLLAMRDHSRPTTLTPVEVVGRFSPDPSKGHRSRPSAKARPVPAPVPSKMTVSRAESRPAEPENASAHPGHLERLEQPSGGSADPGPGSSVGAGGSATGSALQLYVAQVVKKIDDAKVYPDDAIFRGEEGHVVLSLQVLPDGVIQHFHLAEPCPFESLNHAALDTVARVGRLSPLPEGRNRPLTIRIPLNYALVDR